MHVYGRLASRGAVKPKAHLRMIFFSTFVDVLLALYVCAGRLSLLGHHARSTGCTVDAQHALQLACNTASSFCRHPSPRTTRLHGSRAYGMVGIPRAEAE